MSTKGKPLGVALLAAILACGAAGAEAKKGLVIGDREEQALGARMAAQVKAESKMVPGGVVTQYVNRVGQRIVRLSDRPEIQYRFSVIESQEANAFSLPGGYVYICTGLLKQLDTEAQLAAVLGHEVSHVVARHGVKQLQEGMKSEALDQLLLGDSSDSTQVLVEQGLGLLRKGYTRSMEAEADDCGLLYSARVGLNPGGIVEVFQKLQKLSATNQVVWENLSSAQPPAMKRLAALQEGIRSKGLDAGLPNDPNPYRRVKTRLP